MMRAFLLSALATVAAAQSFDCTLLLSVSAHNQEDIEKFFAEVGALAGVAVHSNSTYCKDEECQLIDDPNVTPRAPPAPPGGYEYAHLPYSTHAVDEPFGKGPAEVIAAAETATAQRAAPEPRAAAAPAGVRAAEAPASSGVSALIAGAAAVVAVAAVAMGVGIRRQLKSPSKKSAKPAGLRLP